MRFLVLIAITLNIGFAAMAQDVSEPSATMRPDVYPSRQSAADAMADQIAAALSKASTSGPTITLIYSTSTVPPFTSDLADALQARFPSVSIVLDQVHRHKPTTAPTINIVDRGKSNSDSQGDFSAIFVNPVSRSQNATSGDQPSPADWTTVAPAVADQIAESLAKAPNVGPTITLIYASCDVPAVTSDLANAIQARFPSVSVVIEQVYRPKPTTAPTTSVVAPGKSKVNNDGNFFAALSKPATTSIEVKYVNKPWAADWTTFINSEVPNSWTVGKSNGLCFNEDKADQIAYVDAARQIVPMIRQRYATNLNQWNDDKMNDLVVHCLTTSNANAVNDKFVQHFNVSDGPAWRESILVSTDHNTLNTLAASIYDTGNGYAGTPMLFPFQKFVSAIALVVVILLLYLFLNWITKGYFSTRLKITMFAVLVVVGILFLLRFWAGPPVYVQH